MTAILVPTLIIGGIGAVCGIVLAVASVIMAVPVDERVEAIKKVLPGANCGACGFPGCDGFANAVAKGDAPVTACPPGGKELAVELAAIMGVEAGDMTRQTAVVHCNGCNDNTHTKMNYIGSPSCTHAAQLYGGQSACLYACLGLESCMKVCTYNAIRMVNGIAVIDPDLCVGCKLCIAACPKGIIAMAPAENVALVSCSSKDKGPVVRKNCSVGCIGCTLCVKACSEGAISMDGFLAKIDYSKCNGCGACVAKCPQKTIRMVDC